MRVILDTNVLISALLWQEKLLPIYSFINKRKITLCFSRATFDELIKVIHYACAVSCQASFIVSGDKHLLRLEEFQGIPIVSPREFLKIIKK